MIALVIDFGTAVLANPMFAPSDKEKNIDNVPSLRVILSYDWLATLSIKMYTPSHDYCNGMINCQLIG